MKRQKMLNFEIKTRILNFEGTLKKVRDIGATYKELMNQKDYYFQTGTKKEKIREINNKEIFLISYNRSEKKGRKESNYTIKPLLPEQEKLLLKQKQPLCIINKTRQLWIYKNTRIHIDSVVGLGNFMELETVVKDISENQGRDEFKEIIKKLEIELKKSEPYSYSDLILNKA